MIYVRSVTVPVGVQEEESLQQAIRGNLTVTEKLVSVVRLPFNKQSANVVMVAEYLLIIDDGAHA